MAPPGVGTKQSSNRLLLMLGTVWTGFLVSVVAHLCPTPMHPIDFTRIHPCTHDFESQEKMPRLGRPCFNIFQQRLIVWRVIKAMCLWGACLLRGKLQPLNVMRSQPLFVTG